MAQIFPSYESIKQFKPPPTEGELQFLDFLKDSLADDFEIYFQPFLNGDCPDIVVMRKGGGVMIVEVKDWQLDSYHLDYRKRWFVSHNNALVKSPVSQVLQYKENTYNLHIENLLELKLKDFRYWSIVTCAVFFSKEKQNRIRSFLFTPFDLQRQFLRDKNAHDDRFKEIDQAEVNYETFLNKNVDILGCDNLTIEYIMKILHNRWISRDSFLFTEQLYSSFKRYLKPSFHSHETGKDFNYTSKQKLLSESKTGEQKIKGIVGSGKTLVLARRAVNAHKRTGGKVLILTFNIALKNYIHDKISSVREDFNWESFQIVNYHDYFNSVLNNLEIQFDIPEGFDSWSGQGKEKFFNDNYYGNIDLFEDYDDRIVKYSTILIDEVQDFKTVWLRIIKKYFLIASGEFVVFGDSKQDIYDRVSLVNNKKELVVPDSPGRWAELNESFRLTPTITSFASSYQKEFLAEKHIVDKFENVDFQAALFDKVHYKHFDEPNANSIVDYILLFSKKNKIHPNDICVLAMSVELIREIDKCFRDKSREKTYIMAETLEYFEHLKNEFGDTKRLEKELDRIRKNKKFHFWMNSGLTKFSTVHSYKGWEINTLFLLVQPETFESTYRELIYTGFTRCMNNLVILNMHDLKLDAFSIGLPIVLNEKD